MVRGTIVQHNSDYYVYLSNKDGEASVAVIEKVMDPIQQEEVVKCAKIIKVPFNELTIPEKYPSYLKQINFA